MDTAARGRYERRTLADSQGKTIDGGYFTALGLEALRPQKFLVHE